jgi:hypothetical protein
MNKMPTTKKPIELVHATTERESAWKNYFDSLDWDASPKEKDAAFAAAVAADQKYFDWCDRWEALGCSSDIESIAAAELDALRDIEADLGTHWIVSGGEALEIGAPRKGDDSIGNDNLDNIPF